MALTTEQKASFLFKQAQGVAETSVTRDFFEEPKKGPTLVLNNQIWAESGSIPTTAPTLADGQTSGVVQRFIDRTMTAISGVSNSFYLAELVDAIPFNFGDGSYNYALKDSSGNTISFGQGDWLVENTGGVLTFYGITPGNMPPKISFYKYVGQKGFTPGGSGVTSVNGFTGAVVLTTSDIAEGTNLYFTDARAQNAVVTSDTSGAQTNLAPSIAALKTYVASQLAASSVTSVNGLTGAVVLTTTDVGEGTNLYFTDARAQAAAVVDDVSGSQTNKAPSVHSIKNYIAANSVVSVNGFSGTVVLTTSDIAEGSNLYFTDSRAQTAAVIDSTAGDQLNQAPSVHSTKEYVTNAVAAEAAARQAEDALLIPLSQKGAADGVATLDNTGKVPATQIPPTAITSVIVVATIAERDALAAQEGDFCVVTDVNETFVYNGADWIQLETGSSVISVNGQTGAVSLSTSDIAEGTNLYFTDARAKLATVINSSAGNETDQAMSVAAAKMFTTDSVQTETLAREAADALLIPLSQKGAANGVATLGSDGLVPLSQLPASTAPVTSVNSLTGAVELTTTNINEGTNLYFTDERAKTAAVLNTTAGNQTDQAPSVAAMKAYVAAQDAPVTSVNTLTGAVVLTTTNISEGTNLYFTNARAQTAAVINNTSGSETNQAPSVSAMKAYVAAQGAPVTSVNTLTGAVVLTTTNISEGTNLYFTNARAQTAAVVNSTAGSEINQAPSVSAMKAYVAAQGAPVTSVNSLTGAVLLNTGNVPEGTQSSATWTSSGLMTVARTGLSSAGTQDAAMAFGGYNGAFVWLSSAERFNGTTWSSAGTMTAARGYLASCGTQTAALIFGGRNASILSSAELYNGSTYSSTGSLSGNRMELAAAGIQNAGLSIGGNQGGFSAICQTFNGSTWASTGSLNTAKYTLGGCGLQNAALAFGGAISGGTTAVTEKFNGTTWSTTGSLIFARSNTAGAGTQDNAVAFGGTGATTTATTERFNSSTWSSSTSMPTATYDLGGAGTQNSALAMGGTSTTQTTVKYNATLTAGLYFTNTLARTAAVVNSTAGSETDQAASVSAMKTYITGLISTPSINAIDSYNFESTSLTGSITFSNIETTLNFDFWNGTGPLTTARRNPGGAGTQNAALAFGGFTTVHSNITDRFNGSSWVVTGNLVTARSSLGGVGIQSAALAFGGDTGAASAATEKYNGATWTATGNLVTARYSLGGAGTQNAALAFGGRDGAGAYIATAEKFNGATWSATGSLGTGRAEVSGAGTQNAALAFGGFTGAVYSSVAEKFNGNTWVTTGSFSSPYSSLGSSGTQNAALAFGGLANGSNTAITQKFNGAAWTTTTSLSTPRNNLAGAGTQNAALGFGGTSPLGAVCERFQGQILQGFQGVYKGTSNSLNIFNSDNNITMNLGSDSGILQLNTIFDVNGGLSNQEIISISELEREDYQSGEWSASAYISTARYGIAGAGTQNAALAFGGYTGAAYSAVTEKFDGNAWTATGSLATARFNLAGAGTQNAALAFGGNTGSVSSAAEKFNGATWSSTGSLGTGRNNLAGAGTQNAALAFGGSTGSLSTVTEKFNGSTWATAGNLGTARNALAGTGTQNAALAFGGDTGSVSALTQEFNGSIWYFSGNLILARFSLAGAGVINASLAFGGSTGSVSSAAEKYNGATWSSTGSLSFANQQLGGSGLQNAALAFGGRDSGGTATALTEIFSYSMQFIPRTQGNSTWSSSGNMATAVSYMGGAGTQNAALSFGGLNSSSSQVNTTQKFTVSTWSSTGNLTTARSALGGAGTQNAALAFGGFTGSVNSNVTEKFNSSTWATTGTLTTARYGLGGAGNQNAALAFGGFTTSANNTAEKFNGTSWTTTGNLSAIYYMGGAGTQNAALSFGGTTGSITNITEKFNGSTWASTGTLVTARRELAGCGNQNAAICFGGYTTFDRNLAEKFNGFVWIATGNLGTSRYALGGAGLQNAALSFGGFQFSTSAVTEKYTETSIGALQYG